MPSLSCLSVYCFVSASSENELFFFFIKSFCSYSHAAYWSAFRGPLSRNPKQICLPMFVVYRNISFSFTMCSLAVHSTVVLQQDGFESQPGVFVHGVCLFSLCIHGFSPVTQASSHNGYSKFPFCMNVCVHSC
ncbi:hypothetical protein AMECASPLE_038543 [Ameca splendens]|uniref:Secreted protein n=1 Tax=Ameca splendens TaxID=208324 RepID=A0ABV0YJD9_9TELE